MFSGGSSKENDGSEIIPGEPVDSLTQIPSPPEVPTASTLPGLVPDTAAKPAGVSADMKINTWDELLSAIKGEYKISEEEEGHLRLAFSLEGDRSQIVFFDRMVMAESDWVEIMSPVGSFNDIDLNLALSDSYEFAVGGLVKAGELLMMKHTVQLVDVTPELVFGRMFAIMQIADTLEEKLTGEDKF